MKLNKIFLLLLLNFQVNCFLAGEKHFSLREEKFGWNPDYIREFYRNQYQNLTGDEKTEAAFYLAEILYFEFEIQKDLTEVIRLYKEVINCKDKYLQIKSAFNLGKIFYMGKGFKLEKGLNNLSLAYDYMSFVFCFEDGKNEEIQEIKVRAKRFLDLIKQKVSKNEIYKY